MTHWRFGEVVVTRDEKIGCFQGFLVIYRVELLIREMMTIYGLQPFRSDNHLEMITI